MVGHDWPADVVASRPCGSAFIDALVVGQHVGGTVDTRSGRFQVATVHTVPEEGSQSFYGALILNKDYLDATTFTTNIGTGVFNNVICPAVSGCASTNNYGITAQVAFIGPVNSVSTYLLGPMYNFVANWTGIINRACGMRDTFSVSAGASGTILEHNSVFANGCPSSGGVRCVAERSFTCPTSGNANDTNICFHGVEQSGGLHNAWAHINCNTVNDGCSIMAGTAYDTKWSRCRAGAWCPGGNTLGQDIYTDGFLCAGAGTTCSAMTTTNVGVYDSGLRVFNAIAGTTNQIVASSANGPSETLSLSTTLVAPGSFQATTFLRGTTYGCVGCSAAPAQTTTGDWTATRIFQGANQVTDTITCTGCTAVKTGNSYALTVSASGVTSIAGTANQITMSASTGAVTAALATNPVMPGYVTANHYVTAAGTPTCTVQTGAGTGATCTIAGTDSGMNVIIVAGTSPVIGTPCVTITYSRAWATQPFGIVLGKTSSTTGTELPVTADCIVLGFGSTTSFDLQTSCTITPGAHYGYSIVVMG